MECTCGGVNPSCIYCYGTGVVTNPTGSNPRIRLSPEGKLRKELVSVRAAAARERARTKQEKSQLKSALEQSQQELLRIKREKFQLESKLGKLKKVLSKAGKQVKHQEQEIERLTKKLNRAQNRSRARSIRNSGGKRNC